MVSVKSLIWNVEDNEETVKKLEDVIYNNKEKIKNLCFDFILWVMKQVPEKYERKIFSFLYNGVSIEKGYNKYYAKIPTKKEIGDMKSILKDSHIENYKIISENNIEYLYIDVKETYYDRYDDYYTTDDIAEFVLPIEYIEKLHYMNTLEDSHQVQQNKNELENWLKKRVEYMENFIAEEKKKEEENAKKREEEKKKEMEEKEYQQYLELKKKFEDKE